jgi:hypothetical protein
MTFKFDFSSETGTVLGVSMTIDASVDDSSSLVRCCCSDGVFIDVEVEDIVSFGTCNGTWLSSFV